MSISKLLISVSRMSITKLQQKSYTKKHVLLVKPSFNRECPLSTPIYCDQLPGCHSQSSWYEFMQEQLKQKD